MVVWVKGSFTNRKRIRKSFGRIPEVAPMPNLIDVQRASYDAFLQMHMKPDARTHSGLQEVFKSVFPIDDFAGRGRLEFVYYELEEPKYDVEECIQRGMTYAAPLKVILRLIVWDVDEDTGARSIRDIKEQPVYMGDMPLMTDNGTFVVNGTERVIVSQMHRSPGVFFDHDRGKTHSSGKYLFTARVIPYRGSWLDFEFDAKDLVYVRIDRKRKLPVTTLLYALPSLATEKLIEARAAKGESCRDQRDQGHGPRGDPQRLLRPGGVHRQQGPVGAPVRGRGVPQPQADRGSGRCRDRRGRGQGRGEADRPRGAQDRREDQERAGGARRPARPLRGRGPVRPRDRRDLRRGRRGADRAEAGPAGGARASTPCRRWRSTRRTARGSATPWPPTRTTTATMR